MIFLDMVLLGLLPSELRNPAPHDTDPLNLYTSPWAIFPKASRILTRTVVFSPATKILEEGVTSIFVGRAGSTVMVVNPLIPFWSINSKRYTPDLERSDGSRKRYSLCQISAESRSSTLPISSYTRRVYGRFSRIADQALFIFLRLKRIPFGFPASMIEPKANGDSCFFVFACTESRSDRTDMVIGRDFLSTITFP